MEHLALLRQSDTTAEPDHPIRTAAIVCAIVGSIVSLLYALTNDREDMEEEIAADQREKEFLRCRDPVRSAELYLQLRKDWTKALDIASYRPGRPLIRRGERREREADRKFLRQLLQHDLPSPLRAKLQEELELVSRKLMNVEPTRNQDDYSK
jgi:hypothetical protein